MKKIYKTCKTCIYWNETIKFNCNNIWGYCIKAAKEVKAGDKCIEYKYNKE